MIGRPRTRIPKTPLARRIRELRAEDTPKEFAKKIGVTDMRFRQWEAGERKPPYAMLCKMADLRDVHVYWLMTGKTKGDLEEAQMKYGQKVRHALKKMQEGFQRREEHLRADLEELSIQKNIVNSLLKGIDWGAKPSKDHNGPQEPGPRRAANAPKATQH
jgi:transcriptional regulator with XRE-family HTH domain